MKYCLGKVTFRLIGVLKIIKEISIYNCRVWNGSVK